MDDECIGLDRNSVNSDEEFCSASLLDLPDHLLHYICQKLDRSSTGLLSLTCKWINLVCCQHASEVHIPSQADALPPSSFFCCMVARHVHSSAINPTPNMAFECGCVVKRPIKWPSLTHLAIAGSRPHLNPYQFHALIKTSSLVFSGTTSLILSGLRLTAPPPLFILQAIPVHFPSLEAFEIVDTRIGCPASSAKWEAVGSLLNEIMLYEGSPPQPGQIDALVVAHEARMQDPGGNGGGKNVLVAMELCKSISCLKKLKRLKLTGYKTLHLHNLALSCLSSCSRLESLSISLPSVWPYITARSLQALPLSLKELTLHTINPATMSSLLSSIRRARTLICNIRTPGYGGTAYPGYEKWRAAMDEDSLLHEIGVVKAKGNLGPSFTFLGPSSMPDDLLSGEFAQHLASLSIKSSVPDLDPLTLSPSSESTWNERQRDEFKILKWILSSQPELKRLELMNVGPQMMSLLCSEEERAFDGLVALEWLSISCHSNIDPSPLLLLSRHQNHHAPSIRLSLALRGLSKSQVMSMMHLTIPDHLRKTLAHLSLGYDPGIHPWYTLESRLTTLTELHLQRISDLTDEDVTSLFTNCPSLRSLFLTSCRSISSEAIHVLGRMRRRLKISVLSCRLVDSSSWLKAVRQAAQLEGVVVLDVKVPKVIVQGRTRTKEGLKEDHSNSEWCSVEFGP